MKKELIFSPLGKSRNMNWSLLVQRIQICLFSKFRISASVLADFRTCLSQQILDFCLHIGQKAEFHTLLAHQILHFCTSDSSIGGFQILFGEQILPSAFYFCKKLKFRFCLLSKFCISAFLFLHSWISYFACSTNLHF